MNRDRLSLALLVIVAVVALTASTGCCRKPPEEVGQAQAAVAAAKENCAEVYAGEEYKKAYDAMSLAEQYGTDHKCKDAKLAAEQAIQLAADAEVRANARKAELDTEVKTSIKEIEDHIAKETANYNNLMRKKADYDKKKAAAMQAAEEKDFAKFNITMDFPAGDIDRSIETDGQAILADFEKVKAMYAEGGCNLLDVVAKLKEFQPRGEQIAAKIAANDKALDEAINSVDSIMEMKLAELEKAIKAQFKTSHTVVKGECLWKIAEYELVYNDPYKWPLIWWENRWTEERVMNTSKEERFNLIKDPDLIFPGQNLKIKQEVTQDEMDSAVKYAKNRYGLTDWRDIPDFLTDGK